MAIELAGSEYGLRDFLLGGAVAMPVEALQHSAEPRALLTCQSRVRWNGAAVKGREQATDRGDSVEAFDAERDKGDKRYFTRGVAAMEELDALTVAEIIEEKGFSVVGGGDSAVQGGALLSVCGKKWWRLSQNNGARVVLRQPEYPCAGRSFEWVDREIVTPTAAGSCRSADVDQPSCARSPGNRDHRIHCGGAIPTRDRMR